MCYSRLTWNSSQLQKRCSEEVKEATNIREQTISAKRFLHFLKHFLRKIHNFVRIKAGSRPAKGYIMENSRHCGLNIVISTRRLTASKAKSTKKLLIASFMLPFYYYCIGGEMTFCYLKYKIPIRNFRDPCWAIIDRGIQWGMRSGWQNDKRQTMDVLRFCLNTHRIA